jgi:F420-non-reducing hydrogenase small subunit
MALLNLGDDLLCMLDANELVFSPVLMDVKSPRECDVALVEGCVRNEENIGLLKEVREKAKTVVALGTCSSFGGIPGLGSAFASRELIEEAYSPSFLPEGIPALEARVSPIDQFIHVDAYLPGCPPPLRILGEALKAIIKGETPERHDLPICAECPRGAETSVGILKRTLTDIPKSADCLLSQGYVCLGSVSRGGCGAPCPAVGVPCLGCRGPIDRIFTDPSHGIIHDLVRRISHFTDQNYKDVESRVLDQLHCLYAYTLSVPEMRSKNNENIAHLIHRNKV